MPERTNKEVAELPSLTLAQRLNPFTFDTPVVTYGRLLTVYLNVVQCRRLQVNPMHLSGIFVDKDAFAS